MKDGRFFLVAFLLLVGGQAITPFAAADDVLISPDNPNLVYVGRWNFEDPAKPWCAWHGCSVKARFEGGGLGVRINPGNNSHYFGVIVDDDISTFTKFQADSEAKVYPLKTDFYGREHTVELIRESHATNNWEFLGFVLRDAELLSPGPPRERKIEFYGDSNLEGTSNESERDRFGRGLKGTTFVYAGIVARMFDAEYHNLSWGGETISGMNRLFDRFEHDADSAAWDHERFPADLVVVNLGANDIYNKTKAEIKEDYQLFLDDLRAVHPTAHIMLYNAFGWDKREPANYIHEVIAERGDANMSSAVFPWVFEQFHGCQYDQGGMAQYLANHVTETLGWEQKPIDTLNGYGMDGDVANGSFEEVSPFGGWAWRYFDDAGVTRVHNPDEAHEGDYFVLLQDGAQTHQPNPASDGDVVTAKMWLRGSQSGARAKVTVDFRNQQIYSDPMSGTSEFFELNDAWQLFSVTATAPIDGPDPVFNVRVTIEAGSGDNVLVDSVSMMIE